MQDFNVAQLAPWYPSGHNSHLAPWYPPGQASVKTYADPLLSSSLIAPITIVSPSIDTLSPK